MLKLCWGQLGSSAQGMKNHWTSFSAAKKGSHWNFSHGIKTSVYVVFGLSWKKKTTFFWRATKNFAWLQKYPGRLPSGPTLTGPPSTWPDVTGPSAPDFDVSLWDSSLSSAQLVDKARPPGESPPSSPMSTNPPDRKEVHPLKTNMTGWKNPPCSIGNESSNGGCFIVMLVFGGYKCYEPSLKPTNNQQQKPNQD